jgi:predicted transcriptional regulator
MAPTLYYNIRLSVDDKTKLDTMAESMKLSPEQIVHRLIAKGFKVSKLDWPPEPKTTKRET